jgi:hypothetical protein
VKLRKEYRHKSLLTSLYLLLLIFVMSNLGFVSEGWAAATTSGDAYIDWNGSSWVIGNSKIEKKLLFVNGSLQCVSLVNKLTNRQYVQAGQVNPEFQVVFGGTAYYGNSGGWTLEQQKISVGYQDAIYLDITLWNAAGLKVLLHYIVFPNVGVIKHQTEFKNVSGVTKNFVDPSIFTYRLMASDVSNLDLHYMTGGGNFAGSNMLKTVPLTNTYSRTFDSYDAPEWMKVDGDSSSGVGLKRYQGTTIYNEFFVLKNRATNDGLWLTFDYNGHWKSRVGNISGTNVNLWGTLAGINIPIANGDGFTTGYHTIGTFTGDIDDMGNTILDYVYTYQWDYYNEFYHRGGTWAFLVPGQGVPESYATPIYKMIQWSRNLGGGGIHIDQFATSRAGDWNSVNDLIDFKKINAWGAKSNFYMKLWMPPWHSEDGSWVKTNHPEWQPVGDQKDWCGWHVNLAHPDAYNWMLSMVQNKADTWGTYMLRLDGEPSFPSGGSDNVMIKQSENFYKLLKAIKDTRPGMGIENCSGGGQNYTMEAVRFSEGQQLTDGNSHHYTGYWNTLLIPPAKAHAWFGVATGRDNNYSNGQDKSPSMIEHVRTTNDFGHYMWANRIMKRWTKVYRPTMTNGDGTFFIQYMTGDNKKGVFLTSHYCPYFNKTIRLNPKGLIDSELYTVKARLGGMTAQTQTGAYWKANGITYFNAPGEVITFNMPNFPGSRTDTIPPGPPSNIRKNTATYMGRNGVELYWTPGSDNNWVSAHEIFINGAPYTKQGFGPLSVGYTFIENGNINANYQLRTIDGDGNVSALISVGQINPTPIPTPVPGHRINVAAAQNGGVATASSTHSNSYASDGAINGDRSGAAWGNGGGWNDATRSSYPDWLQVDFSGSKKIDEIDIFGVQDNYKSPVEPTDTMISTKYALTDFDVQYWDGANWVMVPGGRVTGNNKVWRKFTFSPLSTTKIRVLILGTVDGWSRITELEAWQSRDTAEPTPQPTPTPVIEESVDISLREGWNLISLPVQPSNTAIDVVLAPILGSVKAVYAYEANIREYRSYEPGVNPSKLEKLEVGRGYWIEMTKNQTLTLKGVAASKAIKLIEGWNLVGYSTTKKLSVVEAMKSINGKYVTIYSYDPINNSYKGYSPDGKISDLTEMVPGSGYWINASEATDWILPK